MTFPDAMCRAGRRVGAIAAAVVVATAATCASAMEATLRADGVVDFGGRELCPLAFLEGWLGAGQAGGYEIKSRGTARYRMSSRGRSVFDATTSLSQLDGGAVRIDYAFRAVAPATVESIGCTMRLPRGEVEGLGWRTESGRGTFAAPKKGIAVSSGKCVSLGIELGAGRAPLRFCSTNAVDYLVQDCRQWSETYGVRLGSLKRRRFAAGETFAMSITVKSSEALTARDASTHVISASGDWVPIDYHRDIEEGSALDFSHMGFADAPAGKHGWLRNVGGHFVFEGLPGMAQRFYGVNLCGTANFPDHALADALVKRFRRIGYNSIRMHHHDAGLTRGRADGVSLNDENAERFDYFVAAAIREGLYITTDVYVSRSHNVKWRHLGIDRDGTMDVQRFKALCAVYEPAFENWAAFAKNFFGHVNPYTGRSYADEPAMPLISLVNEGGFFMGWSRGVRDDERVLASWRRWLSAKRAADPSFAPEASADRLPESFWDAKTYPAVAEWTGELEARMVARMKAFLRSIGVKALLTNGNCGPHYAALQRATAEYDYIDDHFYVDHPNFPEKRWSLPSTCPNRNPLLGKDRLAPSAQAFTRMFGKPFTVTEWNFSGPGRYRGAGGMLTGVMAAMQDWDGLWRFAYSHSRDRLGDTDIRCPGYFDLASDPLAQAGERACLCLFMRGDIAPIGNGVALWVTPESVTWREKVLGGAPPWCDGAWKMRVGSCLSPADAKGLRVLRREEADGPGYADACVGAPAKTSISIDRERGAFTIRTARTCGGFAGGGGFDAGFLRARVSGAAATIWVSSLDGAEIPKSKRLLVSHVTDVQGDGTKFSDETMTTLLRWGSRPLVRNGSAEVAVKVDDPASCTVYELATSGRRMGAVKADCGDGWLAFTASVAGPHGARMLYEIVR